MTSLSAASESARRAWITFALLPACFSVIAPTNAAMAEAELRAFIVSAGGGSLTGTTHSTHYTVGDFVIVNGSSANHELYTSFWGAGPHVTSVETEQPQTSPIADRLYQNHPNPFNPSTTIRYDIAESGGRVQLQIYDVAGRMVVTLLDEVQSVGRKSVQWRGLDRGGSRVASGIYFYVLTTARGELRNKMVLLQ